MGARAYLGRIQIIFCFYFSVAVALFERIFAILVVKLGFQSDFKVDMRSGVRYFSEI